MAFGIGAGSASIHYHILTGATLFDRAIVMSGSAPTLGPLPLKLYEKEWQQLCTKCGIEEDDPEKPLKKLRTLSPEQIIGDYSTVAIAGGMLLPSLWNLPERLPISRCKSIIWGTLVWRPSYSIVFLGVCPKRNSMNWSSPHSPTPMLQHLCITSASKRSQCRTKHIATLCDSSSPRPCSRSLTLVLQNLLAHTSLCIISKSHPRTQGRRLGSHIMANPRFSCTTMRAINTQIPQEALRWNGSCLDSLCAWSRTLGTVP
jgi:hypothetical protein